MVRIEPFAFNRCTSLSKIHFPPTLTSIGEGCFSYCTGMIELLFSHERGISTVPALAFANCSSLSSIELGTVQTIGYRAFELSAINKLSAPENLSHIGDMAFFGCPHIQMIDVSAAKTLTFGSDVFLNTNIKHLICNPGTLSAYDFSDIDDIRCHTFARTLGGDVHPFVLSLPTHIKDFNPDRQLIEQTEEDLGAFDLVVDDAPLRVSLDKSRQGKVDLSGIIIVFNNNPADPHIGNRTEHLYNRYKLTDTGNTAAITVSDIPGLEHVDFKTLIDHRMHTLSSLVGRLLICGYDHGKLIGTLMEKCKDIDVAFKISEAVEVMTHICKVYIPGDIYQSPLLEFMSADEARRRTSTLVAFNKLDSMGDITNLPVVITDAEKDRFKNRDITKIYHLIGHYLAFHKDPDLIECFLEDFVERAKIAPIVYYLHRNLIYQQL